ncbi:nucleotidyltransferase family protein [Methanobrevibacter oralis]|uniref:nucleotidyltransferase family protein n=1 Tax=Methanobrevibacter oralis TaxID=66851 RepID=UPI0028FCEA7A|nr:nucleotidyltransferase domain-containing protein [Methanobrevibacter oralis]
MPIAKKYGIDSMSLFGSYARGEATENSDVDFYIDKGDIKGLLDYIGFVQDLEDIFNCHVDVVSTGIQDKTFLALIKKDGVLIYEKQ